MPESPRNHYSRLRFHDGRQPDSCRPQGTEFDNARYSGVHLDVRVPDEHKLERVAELEALGARQLWVTDDRGPVTYTMQDPEGNEFCLH
ncbi:MAG TPA: VOC family protein [Microbacteriaceae bacterium]